MQFHQDHIFASALFRPKELSAEGKEEWVRKKDRLGNLCLLLATENAGKQDMPVADWLRSRDPEFLKKHLIPDDPAIWEFERFSDFLVAREALIRQRIIALCSAPPNSDHPVS